MTPLLLLSLPNSERAADPLIPAGADSVLQAKPEIEFHVAMAKATARPTQNSPQTLGRSSAAPVSAVAAKAANSNPVPLTSRETAEILHRRGQVPAALVEAKNAGGPQAPIVDSQSAMESLLKASLPTHPPSADDSATRNTKIGLQEKPSLPSVQDSQSGVETPVKSKPKRSTVAFSGLGQTALRAGVKSASPPPDAAAQRPELFWAPLAKAEVVLTPAKTTTAPQEQGELAHIAIPNQSVKAASPSAAEFNRGTEMAVESDLNRSSVGVEPVSQPAIPSVEKNVSPQAGAAAPQIPGFFWEQLLGTDAVPASSSAKMAPEEQNKLDPIPTQKLSDEAAVLPDSSSLDVPIANAATFLPEHLVSEQRFGQLSTLTAGKALTALKSHPGNSPPPKPRVANEAKLAGSGPAVLASEPGNQTKVRGESDGQTGSPDTNEISETEFPNDFKTSEAQGNRAVQSSEVLLASPVGTGAAFTSAQMKFASQQNEFAQSAAQKLPSERASVAGIGPSSDFDCESNPPLASDFASDKMSGHFAFNSMAGVAPGMDATHGAQTQATLPTTTLPARIEQIQSLISREIVLGRQSGADGLAVSLKVDSHTDILLQLTTHNGQVEAAVRCERGDVTSLNSHWGQLQESLGRQNVHLLPLVDRTDSRVLGPGASTTAHDFNQQKPAKNYQAPPGESEEASPSHQSAAALAVHKPPTRKAPPKRWESWA